MHQRLADGVSQASHVGVPAPKKSRQICMGLHGIAFYVVGHLRPVNAAHVFAPTENLTHKAFHRFNRCMTSVESVFSRCHHFSGVEQFEVERARQMRVVQPNFAFPHGVLVLTELRQPVLNEIRQHL